MVAYTMPQQRKKEETEQLRGERIRSSSLILDLKDGKSQGSGSKKKARRSINCMFLG